MSPILIQLCLFAYKLFNRNKPGFCHLSFIYLIVNSNVNHELYSQCIVNSTHTVIRDSLNYISVENNFIRAQFYVPFLFPIVLHSPLISKVTQVSFSPPCSVTVSDFLIKLFSHSLPCHNQHSQVLPEAFVFHLHAFGFIPLL